MNNLRKIRFWFYRMIRSNKLIPLSHFIKWGRTNTFVDPFKRITWFGDRWEIGERWGMYHPDKAWMYYSTPLLTPNGGLFSVRHNPADFGDITIPMQVSLLSSQGIFEQQYGRFECRCTIPKGRGLWPAFWLYGANEDKHIEIDFESYGTGVQEINIHYGGSHHNIDIGPKKIRAERDNQNRFHELAIEWYPDRIDFFIDSVKIYSYRDKEVLDEYFNTDIKMWILINHGTKGIVEDSDFTVDYIRAYT